MPKGKKKKKEKKKMTLSLLQTCKNRSDPEPIATNTLILSGLPLPFLENHAALTKNWIHSLSSLLGPVRGISQITLFRKVLIVFEKTEDAVKAKHILSHELIKLNLNESEFKIYFGQVRRVKKEAPFTHTINSMRKK